MARFDDGLTAEIQVNPEFGSASAAMAEARTQKLIYCESGRIGPYFLDFSANRTTMHLQIEKIWPRFPTFSLRSFLPRRLLANMGDSSANCQPFFEPMSRRSGSIKGISLSGVETTIFSFMQIMRKSPSPRVFWRRNWSTRGRTLPWTHPGWGLSTPSIGVPPRQPMATSFPTTHEIIRSEKTSPSLSCRTWLSDIVRLESPDLTSGQYWRRCRIGSLTSTDFSRFNRTTPCFQSRRTCDSL